MAIERHLLSGLRAGPRRSDSMSTVLRLSLLISLVSRSSAFLVPPAAVGSDTTNGRAGAGVQMGLFDFLPGFSQETPPDGCVRASHIMLLDDDGNNAQKKANELLRRISNKEISFADAARGFSCCPSRDLNGFLGTFSSLGSLGELPPIGELPYEGKDTTPFDEVLFSAPLGTPVAVASQWGVHLILVEARGAGAPTSSAPAGVSNPNPPSSPPSGGGGAAW
jgi:hypothetical protein